MESQTMANLGDRIRMSKRLSKTKVERILQGTFPKLTPAQAKKKAEFILAQKDTSNNTKKEVTTDNKKTKLLLERKYDQGQGKEDLTELTEHQEVKELLNDLVQKATRQHNEYVGYKKQLITSTAFHIEEYLKRIGKDQYICRISEILTHVLKTRVKGYITDMYMRRCLDQRYKNPEQRNNALQRQQQPKSSEHGLPKDSGRSLEELEASLHRVQPEEYKSEDLDKYDRHALISIIKYLDNKMKMIRSWKPNAKDIELAINKYKDQYKTIVGKATAGEPMTEQDGKDLIIAQDVMHMAYKKEIDKICSIIDEMKK